VDGTVMKIFDRTGMRNGLQGLGGNEDKPAGIMWNGKNFCCHVSLYYMHVI
jgi:hypothetical protein